MATNKTRRVSKTPNHPAQPDRRKVAAWVTVAVVAITTLGTVAVAVAKGADAPSFTFNLSLQIMATNAAKASAVGQP